MNGHKQTSNAFVLLCKIGLRFWNAAYKNWKLMRCGHTQMSLVLSAH